MQLSIQPMQWEALPLLHDAPGLDESDAACLAGVRAVLAAHGKLERFALHLAHRHIDLAPGEVLIEWPDPGNRTQHVTVGRLEDYPHARPTTWLMASGEAVVLCACVPVREGDGLGCAGHAQSIARRNADEAIDRRRISEEEAQRQQPAKSPGRIESERNQDQANER